MPLRLVAFRQLRLPQRLRHGSGGKGSVEPHTLFLGEEVDVSKDAVDKADSNKEHVDLPESRAVIRDSVLRTLERSRVVILGHLRQA